MSDDVLIERSGVLGRVTLNRPKAINALTHAMAREIEDALLAWRDDPAVGVVLVGGAGERGLCAGGDIRTIYEDARAGGVETLGFWRDEYRLNALIGAYPKPVVALMHGLVMGGGIGLAGHAGQRVVTDGSVLGMPEVGIGLVPDVGGTWLLSRAPGELGAHIALTAARLGPGDAIEAGLADWYVPREWLPGLAGALADIPAGEDDVPGAVGAAIQQVARPAPWSELAAQREWIDEVLHRRLGGGDPGPAPPLPRARGREGRRKDRPQVADRAQGDPGRPAPGPAADRLEQVLNQEFRVSTRCFAAPDLAEGIRAQVIDKDRDPQWVPASLAEVTESSVASYFDSLGEYELRLPEGVENGEVAR